MIYALKVSVTALLLIHGPAAWINEGNYKNALGELCCGERDCVELRGDDVKITPSGYLILPTRELVPFSEATPSENRSYWVCHWGGQRKCFFAPFGNT